MPYKGLGSRGPLLSTLDGTGQNTGNWTTAFTTAILGIDVPYYECFHIVVDQVPAGAFARVNIGTKPWGYTNPQGGSEWDPEQPMLLNPGQEIYFLWSVAASGTPPRVTMWFRYDTLLPRG